MDGSAPKINVAPSSDNTTPEAIKPTVTEQAAAEPTIAVDSASTDDLVEIEGSVGEQNLAVEEVASPSLVPPLHSPPATQQPIAGEEEVKIQEATQLDEHQARVEVPVPNTQVYEPPPEPSLDSDAINAARVQDVHEVEEESIEVEAPIHAQESPKLGSPPLCEAKPISPAHNQSSSNSSQAPFLRDTAV